MSVFSRNHNKTLIVCKISLSFDGDFFSQVYNTVSNANSFHDQVILNGSFNYLYHTPTTFNYSAIQKHSESGNYTEKRLSFKFPTHDIDSQKRINEISKVKAIKLTLNNNQNIFIGKNDFSQNARIKPIIETNINFSEITFTQISLSHFSFIS